jgi:hypothetical protein
MSDNITPRQTLIMWCLLGRHGWAFQRDILPEVDRKDREALVAAGYITSTMINRALLLKVEDKGWHWATNHLEAKLPPAMAVLQNWLGRLHEFLVRSGGTLADFVGPAPEAPPEPAARRPRARARKLAPPRQTQSWRVLFCYRGIRKAGKGADANLPELSSTQSADPGRSDRTCQV